MKIWVVTGPIGAGKSSVSRLLAEHGAVIVDADRLGHEVLEDPVIIEAVAREFGSRFVQKDGQQPDLDAVVDRAKLGALVFADELAMKRLNALTHPPLVALAKSRLQNLSRQRKHKLAVLEAAVYFLWPPVDVVDLVISVVANEDVRRHRLMSDRGLNAQQVQDRMDSQQALEAFWPKADVVLENNHKLHALQQAVDDLLKSKNL